MSDTKSNRPEEAPPEEALDDASIVWYLVALIMTALGTILIGYVIGTTLEGQKAEETLEAVQQEHATNVAQMDAESTIAVAGVEANMATSEAHGVATVGAINAISTQSAISAAAMLDTSRQEAVANLATSEAQGQSDLENVRAEATQAMATSRAEATQAIATQRAEATEAINQVTQAVGEQRQQTAEANATETAIVEAYTPTPTATATPLIPEGEVQSVTTIVRLGPGEAFPIIGNLNQGQMVEIIGVSEDGEWLQVQYIPAGGDADTPAIGFVPATVVSRTVGSMDNVEVASDYPSLTPTPSLTYTPTPTTTHTPTFTPTALPPTPTPSTPEAQVMAIAVTVHEGPGEEYPIADVINQDAPVSVVGTSEDGLWLQVIYEGGTGFVRAEALQLTGGSLVGIGVASYSTLPPPTIAPTPSVPEAMAAGQFVVVREGPGEVFPTVGIVSTNQILELTGVSVDGVWFQVAFDVAPDGLGWVSGQVVNVAGDLGALPAVAGPPPPEGTEPTVGEGDVGTGASSSAGSLGPVDVVELPDTLDMNYDQLPDVGAYSYEVTLAINGEADGDDYQSFVSLNYAQSEDGSTATVTVDVTGAFVNELVNNDLAFLSEFMPVTVGTDGSSNYFYSQNDDVCFDLGPDVEMEDVLTQFEALITADEVAFLGDLPANAAFGVVDESGLVGIEGVHYQLLGLEEGGEVVPFDDFKVDLWWSEDETILYGYRITIDVDSEFFFQYRDTLAQFDPAFNEVDNFEGEITFYLLPRAIDNAAEDAAAPPSACADVGN